MDNLLVMWDQITENLRQSLSEPGYQTFSSTIKPLSFLDDVLTLQVPNEFSKEWVKEKCEPILRSFFKNTPNPNIVFHYVISSDIQPHSSDQLTIFHSPPVITDESDSFNPKYSFDHFIVGHNNRFAYAASEAVSKTPAKAYNPLFIYGMVGLGKTHLLHAIGIKIKQNFPQLKVKLVSSEQFTNELVNAIREKKMDKFRDQYRRVDVLFVDDVQFLAGKEQTQEEFFHTFNDLHCCNKQIILTSDRPPKEIPTLELRLRTRFEWGLTADIQPPGFETRLAILQKKVEMNHFDVSDEILHYIATQIPSNVREMEGALNRIVAYASLLNTKITLSIASNVIKDMVGIKKERPLTIAFIKQKVCEYFNIKDSDLCSKNRSQELAYARQLAMYLARELTNFSLPKIGENFGNRDHSTVMYACDKIKGLIQSDSETKSIINVLITNIKSDE